MTYKKIILVTLFSIGCVQENKEVAVIGKISTAPTPYSNPSVSRLPSSAPSNTPYLPPSVSDGLSGTILLSSTNSSVGNVVIGVDGDKSLSFNLNISGPQETIHVPLSSISDNSSTDDVFVSRHDELWNDWNIIPHETNSGDIVFSTSESGKYRVGVNKNDILEGVFSEREVFNGTSLEDVTSDFTLKGENAKKHLWVVYVHGAGSELSLPNYRWNNLFRYIKSGNEDAVRYRNTFSSLVFRYGSKNSIYINANKLNRTIFEKIGSDPYFIIAHSMGGLVARTANAIQGVESNCLGIITLGTPHTGSPLAIPDWLWALFSKQELGGLKFSIYLAHMNDVFNGITYLKNKKLRDVLYDGRVPILDDGARDLAFDGSHPGIPTMKLPVSLLMSGESAQLSTDDKYQSLCEMIFYDFYRDREFKSENNSGCRYNFTESLSSYEGNKGITTPLVVYGGYYPSLRESIGDRNEFVQFSVKSVGDVALRRSSPFADRALAWAAGIMASLPVNQKDDQSSFIANDGLVSLESSLFLSDGNKLLRSSSTPNSVVIDQDVIHSRSRQRVVKQRIVPLNHREIVEGDSAYPELFHQVLEDLFFIRDQSRNSPPFEFSSYHKTDMFHYIKQRWGADGLNWVSYRDGVYDAKIVFVPYDNGQPRYGTPLTTARFTWMKGKYRFVEEYTATSEERSHWDRTL